MVELDYEEYEGFLEDCTQTECKYYCAVFGGCIASSCYYEPEEEE